jgi:hypothetical protein
MFLFGKRILCPYCLVELRGVKNLQSCPQCKALLPVQYVQDYDQHQPFFTQVFGWSQVGKTVFLYALTLMLIKMGKIWPRYAYSAATDATQQKVRHINEYLAKGAMPSLTQLGAQEVYIMLLRNMERWGGRTLVTRDCAGEIFDNLEVPIDQAPYLLNAPTTFMLVSLPDMRNATDGRSIEMLMNNYINTLMKHGTNFKRAQRKLVVVLTKADKIHGLPAHLRNYLINDPLWAAVNSIGAVEPLNATTMQEYIETMDRVSHAIRDWIKQDAAGSAFVQLAESKNIDMRFSLISSTGSDVEVGGMMASNLEPRRVLDPYFWALELQSRA